VHAQPAEVAVDQLSICTGEVAVAVALSFALMIVAIGHRKRQHQLELARSPASD